MLDDYVPKKEKFGLSDKILIQLPERHNLKKCLKSGAIWPPNLKTLSDLGSGYSSRSISEDAYKNKTRDSYIYPPVISNQYQAALTGSHKINNIKLNLGQKVLAQPKRKWRSLQWYIMSIAADFDTSHELDLKSS
ncbi:hypothetical protein QTP88_015857 [Uroleucon formosanum]